MNKQKICIIGDGLAGLSTAIVLSQENIKIDLYTGASLKKLKNDERTTAISESSYLLIKKNLNIKNQNNFWPCKEIKLFYEDGENNINFLNFKEEKKNLMYIFKNKELKKKLEKQIQAKKNINIIKKNIEDIDYADGNVLLKKKKFSYDLIILSTGRHSKFYNSITQGRAIKKNYNEMAVTAIVKHNSKIYEASQFFLREGPLAILPFNKNLFSVVWSVSNIFFKNNKKSFKKILNDKIQIIFPYAKIKNIDMIKSFPIKLDLKTKYFRKNVVILGDGLHAIHPMAGQGFNLVLRDIEKLSDLISNALKLGLSLKNSFLLRDFYQARKSENNILALGINLTNIFFKNNKYFFPVKKKILNNIGKFKFIKKISQIISDRGIIAKLLYR